MPARMTPFSEEPPGGRLLDGCLLDGGLGGIAVSDGLDVAARAAERRLYPHEAHGSQRQGSGHDEVGPDCYPNRPVM